MTNRPDERDHELTIEAVYRTMVTAPNETALVETGRELTVRLGYLPEDLDRVPPGVVDLFAGVSYHADLATIVPCDPVLDLGSGSGPDAFVVALDTVPTGRVTELDMTSEQITKARQLREPGRFDTVTFDRESTEELPFDLDVSDVVLANGTTTLSARKKQGLQEARRVMRPNERLTVSEFVAETEFSEWIRTDAEFWSAEIGGVVDATTDLVATEAAGFEVIEFQEHTECDSGLVGSVTCADSMA